MYTKYILTCLLTLLHFNGYASEVRKQLIGAGVVGAATVLTAKHGIDWLRHDDSDATRAASCTQHQQLTDAIVAIQNLEILVGSGELKAQDLKDKNLTEACEYLNQVSQFLTRLSKNTKDSFDKAHADLHDRITVLERSIESINKQGSAASSATQSLPTTDKISTENNAGVVLHMKEMQRQIEQLETKVAAQEQQLKAFAVQFNQTEGGEGNNQRQVLTDAPGFYHHSVKEKW